MCKMGLDNLCQGCHRTIKEIMDWPYLNEEQRIYLIEVLKSRKVDTEN